MVRAPSLDPRRQVLREAFTPTRPQRSAKRFVGRRAELDRILRALEDDRAHIVLYAERGRGKTSLANLVAEAARGAGHMVGRYTCAADSDFDAIIRGLVRDLPPALLGVPAVPKGDLEGCEAALPPEQLQPRNVLALPGRLTGGHLVLMVDEFDRVLDVPTRTRLADTLKYISDRSSPISFVIIGVSDSLEQLLGRHPSIQRSVTGVPLPLLSDAEIGDIVERGAAEAGLEFPPDARFCIVALARGVPYIAQVLALRAGQAALERNATVITGLDLEAAIACAVAEADPRVVNIYEKLTESGRNHLMVALLRSIAGGAQDEFGHFSIQSEPGGGIRAAGIPVDPVLWGRLLKTGTVRPCVSAGPDSFTFCEATLGHYVLLRSVWDSIGNVSKPRRDAYAKPSHDSCGPSASNSK
jgi:Cdc6-like AAA superfamily ATPase